MILLCKFVNKAQKSAYIVLAGKLFKAVFAYDFFFSKNWNAFQVQATEFGLQNWTKKTRNIDLWKDLLNALTSKVLGYMKSIVARDARAGKVERRLVKMKR